MSLRQRQEVQKMLQHLNACHDESLLMAHINFPYTRT